MTEQEELEYLKQNSPMALPDDPSSSGWSASQIKEKHYAGLFFLYNLFKANRQNLNQAVSDMQEIVDSINEEYEEIINGKNVSAKWDDENNEIKTTYAKILNITNGTIKVLKYIKENGTDDYIYNIEKNLSTLTTNFNTLKAWTDNLKDINSDTSVLRAVQATKDGLGNIINETYATIASLTLVNSSISNIVNGTTIVGKAYNDQLGRRIDTTYIRIADIINVLNDTSTNKPLSAAMGKSLQDQINAINTLLASSDTDLDTIQEIITYIKNNKTLIENITSDKMSYSVLVHNLTTNNDNLPLSASMGYVLKGYIDTINDAETGIQANEAQRILNENQRISNEEARQTGYSGFDSRITANTNAISGIKDGTSIDSFSDVESALATKANTSDVYAKSEVYTKAEAEALINAKCKETADNLRWELGTYDLGVDTVNGTTMLLPTPANTIQATMVRVDGASEVSENLIVVEDGSRTSQGVSYTTDNAKGKLTLNGTATSTFAIRGFHLTKTIPANTALTLFMKGESNAPIRFYFFNGNTYVEYFSLNTSNRIVNFTKTTQIDTIYVEIQSGGVFNNQTFEPMLVVGTYSTLDFKVGYDGIHNLELSGLKVEGANLCQTPTYNGVMNNTVAKSIDFGNLPSGTYSISLNVSANADNRTFVIYYYNNGSGVGNIVSNLTGTGAKTYTFTLDNSIAYDDIRLGINTQSNDYSITLDSLMLNRGSTALAYVPYIAPTTKTIDLTTIVDSNNNKLFPNGKLMGYNDLKDVLGVYNQESKWNEVDLGSLNWVYDEGQSRFYFIDNTNILGAKFPVQSKTINNIIIAKDYTRVSYQNIYTTPYTDRVIAGAIINNVNYLSIRDNAYNTAEAFKTAMSGVMLQYERATYLTSNTNLSQLVKFEAYSNGSITLVNTNNQDTTSTFKYLKEVAK